MKYNQTTYFSRIGAPYSNTRNSWGGESDNKVVLKGWSNEAVREGDHYAVMVDWDSKGTDTRIGYYERKRHVESIQQGKAGFIILSANSSDKTGDDKRFGDIHTTTPLHCIDRFEERGDGEIWAICPIADRSSFKVVKLI